MNNGVKKFVSVTFLVLVILSLLAPLWVFKDLLFPYVTSKAFYFRILIELALPCYVYLLMVQPELRPKLKQPLNWLFPVFLLINLVTALTGDSVVRSLWGNFERMGGVFYLAHLVLLYFYVLCIGQMGGSYLKRFLQSLLWVALIVTINGFFGKIGWPTFVPDPSLPGRVSSTLGNPIYLGSFLVVPMFLAMFLASQAEKLWARYFYVVCSFLFLVGIFLSGTRGALVGLVAGIFIGAVVYLFFTTNKNIKVWGFGIVAIFVLFMGVMFSISSKLPAGSLYRRMFNLKDSNTESRLIQWGVALRGYKDHPILGVGPENYYVIANKYYNPAIFNYDRSWFDKPHNYLLEILVTNGVFGLAAYLAALFYMSFAFYRGWKTGFLSLLEFSAMLAGLIVYQVQNLTVFDTVPASLMFYAFAGLAGYIWYASKTDDQKQKSTQAKKPVLHTSALPAVAFGLALIVVGYMVYATNVVPMLIASNVNYGYAYGGVDPVKADQYFQSAVNMPFNFDKTEMSSKYADFATGFARTSDPKYTSQIGQTLNEAEASLNDALTVQPDYPILWQRLSLVYLFRGFQNGKVASLDPRAVQAIQKAVALAPDREDAYLTLAQIKTIEGDTEGAKQLLLNLMQKFPADQGAPTQLTSIYRIEGKNDLAVQVFEKYLEQASPLPAYQDMRWVISYYVTNKQYDKAIKLVSKSAQTEPNNLDVFSDLAMLYAYTGQKDQAINLAQAIIKSDPTREKQMQAVIDAVNATSAPAAVPVKK